MKLTLRLQNGDTLVEVGIALAILAMVLASSFAGISAAFRLGREARERVQAINFLQQQAEALHSYRDNNSWDNVVAHMEATPGWQFSMQLQGAGSSEKWVPVLNNTPKGYNPPNPDGTPSIFYVTIGSLGFQDTDGHIKRYDFSLQVTWPAEGSGPDNATSISFLLVDLDGLKSINCEVGVDPSCQ